MRKYIFLLALTFLFSCADDDGNYDYIPLNEITIGGITKDSVYAILQYDTLKFNIDLSFKSEKLTDLSYEWKLNYKTISTEKNCNASVAEKPLVDERNPYYASFWVTDNKTGLKYYTEFRVVVDNPYSRALFILSEQENEASMLSFQRRDTSNMPIVHGVFEDINPLMGSLGSKPKKVFFQSEMLGVLSMEGDKNMTLMDPLTLEVSMLFTKDAITNYDGEFTPEYIQMYREGMIASNGNLFLFNYMNNNTLSPPVKWSVSPPEHHFAPWVDNDHTMGTYGWMSYDNMNEKFAIMEIVPNTISFDKVTLLDGEGFSTAGQKYQGAGYISDGGGNIDKRIVLIDKTDNSAHFYQLKMEALDWDMETFLPIWEYTFTKVGKNDNLIDENSICIMGPKSIYWFISTGNVIKKLHGNGGSAVDFYTVPQGNITCMLLDSPEKRLFIASYDGSKSYLYVVHTETRQLLEEVREMEGKIVSMTTKGNWTDWTES